MKHTICTRWLANPNQGHNHFPPHDFWRLHEHLVRYESGDARARQMVIYGSPRSPILLSIEPRMLIIYEHTFQS